MRPGKAMGAWEVPDSPVFATLGDGVLTQADLDAYIQDRIPAEHQAGFLRDPNRIADLVQQQLLVRQLAAQALKHGLDKEPEVAALLYARTVNELAKLEQQRYVSAHQLDSYAAQAEEMSLLEPDMVSGSDPVISFDQLLISSTRDESRLFTGARMAALYEQYRAGEIDFDTLVAKHSEDPALEDNQGRYEKIDPQLLDEVIAAQLEALDPGQISEPFETRFGWHMVRLVDRSWVQLSEAERMQRFEQLARQRHEASLRTNYLTSLIHQPFEITPGAVRELMARYGIQLDEGEAQLLGEQLTPEGASTD